MSIFHDVKKILKKERVFLKSKGAVFKYNPFNIEILLPSQQWTKPIANISHDCYKDGINIVINLTCTLRRKSAVIKIPERHMEFIPHVISKAIDNLCAFFHDITWHPDIPNFLNMSENLFSEESPFDSMLLLADWLYDLGESELSDTLKFAAENFIIPTKTNCNHLILYSREFPYASARLWEHLSRDRYPNIYSEPKESFENYTHDLDFHFFLRNLQNARRILNVKSSSTSNS